jgi:hypothetical protein
MLYNRNSTPNRTAFITATVLLSLLVFLSYLPGLASYVNSEYQPSLITETIWIDLPKNIMGNYNDLESFISLTAHFGWKKIYWLQGNEHGNFEDIREEINNLLEIIKVSKINNDLNRVGIAYVVLTAVSMFLFLISHIFRNKKIKLGINILSILCLLGAMVSYIIIFYLKIDKDLIDELNYLFKYETNIDHILDHHWRLGSGLLCNIFGLILLPIITILFNV